jgi:hypothetical protein
MKRNVMILSLAKVWNLRQAGKASLVLAALLLLASVVLAQGGYDLSWFTVDGGGGSSSGGLYMLSGTIGQPDTGPAFIGGGYTLVGGFWGGEVAAPGRPVYLPLVLKDFFCDRYEPNNNRPKNGGTPWGPLASGQVINARICPGDPRDVYYFEASGSVQVTIDLTNMPGNADFGLYLLDETQDTWLAESRHGPGQDEQIVYTLPGAGTYYVDVFPYFGTTGSYTLQGSGWQ